jgi:hypothetical protein
MFRRLTGFWFVTLALACMVSLGAKGFAQGTSLGSSSSQTVTLRFTAAGTLGSINVLTQGAPNLDFRYLASGNCSTGTFYSSGQICTVGVTFTPQYPGLRLGAVVLRDNSSNVTVMASTFVSGTGNGPLLAFNPGWQTTMGSGLNTPVASAVDGAGNVYVVDNASGAPVVVKVAAGTGTQTIIGNCPNTTFACTLQDPFAVAVDGAGNVYIADHGSYSEVIEVSADGSTQSVVGGGSCVPVVDPRPSCHLDSPTGVAVDGAGNVYISDNSVKFQSPKVVKVPADGSAQSYISPSSWVTGTTPHSPMGIAIDAAGNLYVTDDGNASASPAIPSQVVMVPVGGAPVTINTGSACSLSTPVGVAVDAAGNLYIADPNNHCVVKVPPSGTPSNVGNGLVNPQGVGVDAAGNVYIADYSMTQLVKLDRSDAPGTPVTNGVPAVSLPTTPNGQQSDPPTAVAIENDGNQPLTFSTINAGTYLLLDGTTTCSTSTPLASAVSCNLEIRFTPTTTGTLTSSVTLTDTGLNSPQTIATTGVATQTVQATLTVTGMPAAAQAYGATFQVGSSGGSGTGAVTFAATGACSVSGSTVTMTSGSGTCSVTATKASDAQYASTTSAPATVLALQVIVNVSGIKANNKTYDGTTTATLSLGSAGLSGVLSGDTGKVSLGSSYTAAFADANVGAGKAVTVIGLGLSGTAAGNYTLIQPSGLTANITAATLTVSGITANNKAYDGTTAATLNLGSASLSGILGSDAGKVSLGISYTATFADANVGTGKAVAVTGLGLTGTAAGNYTLTQPSGLTANITVTALTITAANQTMTYGTAVPSLTGTVTGVLPGDTVTVSYSTTATSTSSVGSYPITPVLNAAGSKLVNYTVNSTNGTLTINKAGAVPAVQSSAPMVLLKNNVTFTAHVTSATSGMPTGTVNFVDGSTLAGSAALDNTGTAILTLSTLAAGPHNITAVYAGDANFTASTSSVLNETVQDFQFIINGASVNDSTQAVLSSVVVSGQVATYQFQMSPTNGATFPSAVTLSLSNLPAGVTYTITPSTLAAGSGTQSVTVQVQTAKSVASMGNGGTGLSLFAAGLLLLPMMGMVWLRCALRSQTKRLALALLVFVVLGVLGMTGCGSGGNGFYDHAAQSYNLQLNGTSGALQHFTTFGLTVQ